MLGELNRICIALGLKHLVVEESLTQFLSRVTLRTT